MRARILGAAAMTGLAVAAMVATPAGASSYGKNSSMSHSVIYTRPCATISVCKLVTVHPGYSFPRDTEYAMPGFGWTMCPVNDMGSPLCFGGSTYRKVGAVPDSLTWYVF
jgi:hypothetical protein